MFNITYKKYHQKALLQMDFYLYKFVISIQTFPAYMNGSKSS
jgi:hypothetical protein